jgi:hypothetical protein
MGASLSADQGEKVISPEWPMIQNVKMESSPVDIETDFEILAGGGKSFRKPSTPRKHNLENCPLKKAKNPTEKPLKKTLLTLKETSNKTKTKPTLSVFYDPTNISDKHHAKIAVSTETESATGKFHVQADNVKN